MSTKVDYKFRETDVVCELTRDVKSSCIRGLRLPEICHECLKRNGIAKQRIFNTKTGGTITQQLRDVGEDGKLKPIVRTEEKIGRNSKCACGSGLKYKKCCGK